MGDIENLRTWIKQYANDPRCEDQIGRWKYTLAKLEDKPYTPGPEECPHFHADYRIDTRKNNSQHIVKICLDCGKKFRGAAISKSLFTEEEIAVIPLLEENVPPEEQLNLF